MRSGPLAAASVIAASVAGAVSSHERARLGVTHLLGGEKTDPFR
ncbi:hypothetical protein Pd630_LPD00311 [Rhodococcus opacus PD630]|nr:hypothetical protein Pd630_LPD00311 [Rhodococcus opacus PD630]